jgi:hypothetical protein
LTVEEIADLTMPGTVACEPWLRAERISAALARDVLSRQGVAPTDDRTRAERSRHGHEARLKAMSTARANRSEPFNTWSLA